MIIGKIKPILVVQKRKEKWSFFLTGAVDIYWFITEKLYKIQAPNSWIFTKQRQHKKSKKSDNANHSWVLRYFVCEAMHVQQLNARHTMECKRKSNNNNSNSSCSWVLCFLSYRHLQTQRVSKTSSVWA